MLDAYERIPGVAHAYQLVEFHLHGSAVAILRILDEKYHQKGDNRCASINDELPRVRKPNSGPVTAQMITTAAASAKVEARPAAWAVRLANSPKNFAATLCFPFAGLFALMT